MQTIRALNNAMNNLLGYPHGKHDAWTKYFDFTPEELRAVFVKWRGDAPRSYGEGLM